MVTDIKRRKAHWRRLHDAAGRWREVGRQLRLADVDTKAIDPGTFAEQMKPPKPQKGGTGKKKRTGRPI
jgi:hypothetical protein